MDLICVGIVDTADNTRFEFVVPMAAVAVVVVN